MNGTYCTKCGAPTVQGATSCPNCGQPYESQAASATPASGTYVPPPPPPPPSSGSYGSTGGSYSPSGGFGGTMPPQAGAPGSIPNYLIHSIVVTLCCCLPLGVVAIIFAAQVNSKLAAGDVAGAQDASNKAKLFCMIGAGVGVVVIIISMLLNGAAFLGALHNAR